MYERHVENYPVKRGKVRDVYDIGENKLVIVSTDRISAYDYVLPSTIPNKGKVLTKLSVFWMDLLYCNNHLVSDELIDMPKEFQKKEFEGRTLLVVKYKVFPF